MKTGCLIWFYCVFMISTWWKEWVVSWSGISFVVTVTAWTNNFFIISWNINRAVVNNNQVTCCRRHIQAKCRQGQAGAGVCPSQPACGENGGLLWSLTSRWVNLYNIPAIIISSVTWANQWGICMFYSTLLLPLLLIPSYPMDCSQWGIMNDVSTYALQCLTIVLATQCHSYSIL